MSRGKLSLRADRIEGIDEIKRIFEALRERGVTARRAASATTASATTPAARCTAPRGSSTRACAPSSPRSASACAEIDDWSCCGASSGAHHRPPARRRPAGAQPGARRGAGLRQRAGALRRLLQPPRRRPAWPWPTRTASPSACPTSSAGRSPTRSRCATPSSCCATPAAAIEEKVAAALTPNPLDGVKLAAYYGCLLVRPAEVCGVRRPRAAAPRWTRSSPPAAPTPSTGT